MKTSKVIGNDSITYQLQYFLIDNDNDKITTNIMIKGDTKKNVYRISVAKDGSFGDIELALIFYITRTHRPEYEVTARRKLPRVGCSITEANNTPDLVEAFGSKEIKVKVENALRFQPKDGA